MDAIFRDHAAVRRSALLQPKDVVRRHIVLAIAREVHGDVVELVAVELVIPLHDFHDVDDDSAIDVKVLEQVVAECRGAQHLRLERRETPPGTTEHPHLVDAVQFFGSVVDVLKIEPVDVVPQHDVRIQFVANKLGPRHEHLLLGLKRKHLGAVDRIARTHDEHVSRARFLLPVDVHGDSDLDDGVSFERRHKLRKHPHQIVDDGDVVLLELPVHSDVRAVGIVSHLASQNFDHRVPMGSQLGKHVFLRNRRAFAHHLAGIEHLSEVRHKARPDVPGDRRRMFVQKIGDHLAKVPDWNGKLTIEAHALDIKASDAERGDDGGLHTHQVVPTRVDIDLARSHDHRGVGVVLAGRDTHPSARVHVATVKHAQKWLDVAFIDLQPDVARSPENRGPTDVVGREVVGRSSHHVLILEPELYEGELLLVTEPPKVLLHQLLGFDKALVTIVESLYVFRKLSHLVRGEDAGRADVEEWGEVQSVDGHGGSVCRPSEQLDDVLGLVAIGKVFGVDIEDVEHHVGHGTLVS